MEKNSSLCQFENLLISAVLYLTSFKQTPTCILFSQGKKYSEGCQTPLFKWIPPNMCTSINLHTDFHWIQLFKSPHPSMCTSLNLHIYFHLNNCPSIRIIFTKKVLAPVWFLYPDLNPSNSFN